MLAEYQFMKRVCQYFISCYILFIIIFIGTIYSAEPEFNTHILNTINTFSNSENEDYNRKFIESIDKRSSGIKVLTMEELQFWADVVNILKDIKFITSKNETQKRERIDKALNSIRNNLRPVFEKEIEVKNPDKIDFSFFDYKTKSIYDTELKCSGERERRETVEKELDGASYLNWHGGFPKNLKYDDWIRYKKSITFFEDNQELAGSAKIINALNKTYLYMFIFKGFLPHGFSCLPLQTFFLERVDCDDIASFTYFILLTTGIQKEKIHLVAIWGPDQKYEHMVLCFELENTFYVLDNETVTKGTSYRDSLKKKYHYDLSDARISICNPKAHIEFGFYESSYEMKSNIKITELDSELQKMKY